MAFADQFKLAYKVMFQPNKTTSTDRPLGDMLKFYYKILAIPLIVFIILELGIYAYGASTFNSPLVLSLVIGGVIVFMLIGNLLAFFIKAVIVHLFGMALAKFKKSFDNTLTGVIYGAVPTTLFIWVLAIPIFGKFIFAIFMIWGLVIAIIAIANQQKVSKMSVLGVFVAIAIVAIILLIALGYLVFTHLAVGGGLASLISANIFAPGSAKCITLNSTYSCYNPNMSSSGKLDAIVQQNINEPVSKVWVGCLLDMHSGSLLSSSPIVNQTNISGYNSGLTFSGNYVSGDSIQVSGLQCYDAFDGSPINQLQPGAAATGLLTIHYTSGNTTRLVYAVISTQVPK